MKNYITYLSVYCVRISTSSKQTKYAIKEYNSILDKNNKDIFITGHSLGGRLVQDVILDDNTVYTSAATFNALGYEIVDHTIMKNKERGNKLRNYYYMRDLVGEYFGQGPRYQRIGKQINLDYFEEHGQVYDIELPVYPVEIHGIHFFEKDSRIQYPKINILNLVGE